MNKKHLAVVGIASIILVSAILFGYTQFMSIKIIGSVKSRRGCEHNNGMGWYSDDLGANKYPAYYWFEFSNEGIDLSDVNFNLTLRGENAEEVTIKRYWGEWDGVKKWGAERTKEIKVRADELPPKLQGYKFTLECNKGKLNRKYCPIPEDVRKDNQKPQVSKIEYE